MSSKSSKEWRDANPEKYEAHKARNRIRYREERGLEPDPADIEISERFPPTRKLTMKKPRQTLEERRENARVHQATRRAEDPEGTKEYMKLYMREYRQREYAKVKKNEYMRQYYHRKKALPDGTENHQSEVHQANNQEGHGPA